MNNYAEIYNFDNYSGKNEMLKNKDIAIVQKNKLISCKDAFNLFWKANTNILYVVDDDERFVGVLTDKCLLKQIKEDGDEQPFINKTCSLIRNKNEKDMFNEAKHKFEKYHITTAIPMVDKDGYVLCEIRRKETDDEEKTIANFRNKILKYEKSHYLGKEIVYLRKLLEEQDIVVIGSQERFDILFGCISMKKTKLHYVNQLENAYEFLRGNKYLLIDLSPIGNRGRYDIYNFCNNGYFWKQFMEFILKIIESEYCSKFYQITNRDNDILYNYLDEYMIGTGKFSKICPFTDGIMKCMKRQHFVVECSKEIYRTDFIQYILKLNGIEVNQVRGDNELTLIEYGDIILQLYRLNKRLSDQVPVLNFVFSENVEVSDAEKLRIEEGQYEGRLHFSNRLQDYAELYSLGENSKEYLEELTESLCFQRKRTFENNMVVFEDLSSRLVNIENGLRKTCYQPQDYAGTIYVLGGCTIWGWLVEDQYTIPSLIQKYINRADKKYRVVNLGNGNVLNVDNLLESLFISNNDLFICLFPFLTKKIKNELSVIEIGKCFNDIRKSKYAGIECFFNMVHHCGTNGNILYSEIIYGELEKHLKDFFRVNDFRKNVLYGIFRTNFKDLNLFFDYESYIEELESKTRRAQIDKKKRIGCVVVNCNPFTFGHKYLIEYALGKVDYLYDFVVEEDKSYFPFADRFELVEKGVRDLKNILVVRSGGMIASMNTFPAYFQRHEASQVKEKISVSMDLKIFSQYIAPRFNIRFRFVGEENVDIVTAIYNKKMKEILPQFGINVIEIPRKCVAGKAVSASVVREYYEKKDYNSLVKWVPDTTLQYLIDRDKNAEVMYDISGED